MSVFPKEVRRNDHAGKYYSFYTKYKENLKTEDQIRENLLKAEDQEAWIENLKNKSRMMRRLYIENEALLNLYIRPFLDGGGEPERGTGERISASDPHGR